MLSVKNSITAFPGKDSTIHVGLDVSISSIRYAIGRKSANMGLEILGISTYNLEGFAYEEPILLSAMKVIKEEVLMEFGVQIEIVHLCVPANLETMLVQDCTKSLLQIINSAGLEIDQIETIGNAASEAVMLDIEKETSCLFLEIRKTGTQIHFYNRRIVSQRFLEHGKFCLESGQVDILALLEHVNKAGDDYQFSKVVITGELSNDSEVLTIAKLIFSVPCRIGIPNRYVESAVDIFNEHDLSEMINSPEYSAVIGLLLRTLK